MWWGSGEAGGQAGLAGQPCWDRQVLKIGCLLTEQFWHQNFTHDSAEGGKHYAFVQ